MTGPLPGRAGKHRWTCAACGKQAYTSRAEAKRAARDMPERALRAYRCDGPPVVWHLTGQSAAAARHHRDWWRGRRE